jgi:hypothetical protein
MKVIELENQNWNIDFHWVKAHAGIHGNELVDKLVKEVATSTENKSYKKIPKSKVIRELNEGSLIKWQNEWDKATNNKRLFPSNTRQAKNENKNYTYIYNNENGAWKLKSYLHRFKIIESPTCPCGTMEQTIDHLLFQCELLGKERDKLISGVAKTDNWPISKNRLIREHFKSFSKFIHEI